MLAILLDVGGGYLVAKYFRNIWLQLVTAVIVGCLSSIAANLVIYAVASDVFAPAEVVARIAGGLLWHPLITVIATVVWRRKLAKTIGSEYGLTATNSTNDSSQNQR